jgi:hypothetical protein
MLARCILTIMGIAGIPAAALELKPDEAKYLVARKYFSYSCFDGAVSTPVDLLSAQIQPSGSARVIALRSGTVRVRFISGAPIQPCFIVTIIALAVEGSL